MRTTSRAFPVLVAAAASLLLAVLASVASAGYGNSTEKAEAVQATAKFHSLVLAKRAGYGLLKDANGIACIAMDDMPAMGAMGVHYANNKLVGDPAVKAETPEALVYEPLGHGKLRLAALEYVVLKSAWDARHSSPPSLFGRRFDFTPDGNRFGLPAFYSLHAWFFKKNPAGTFSMWNPRVHC